MKRLLPLCSQPAAYGLTCAFNAGECPEHGFIPMEPPPPAPTHGDARKIAKQTLLEVGANLASPTAAARFVRSLRAMESFGQSDEERDEILKETSVIGGILHGIPPNTAEKWAMADQLFDPVTMENIRRMTPLIPMSPEDHAEWLEKSPGPVYGGFMSGAREIWGDKAIDYSKPIDTGQPVSEPDIDHAETGLDDEEPMPEEFARFLKWRDGQPEGRG